MVQIRKYLAGELDARAMHRLERQALDDPFLADAIAGYQGANQNQQSNLADLTARLQNRVDANVKRLIPWGPLSIAASILVIIGVGIWFLSGNGSQQPMKVVSNLTPAQRAQPPVVSTPSASGLQKAKDTVDRIAAAVKSKPTVPEKTVIVASPVADAEVAVEPPKMKELEVANIGAKADTLRKAASQTANDAAADKSIANADVAKSQDKQAETSSLNEVVVAAPNANYKSSPQNADVAKKVPDNQLTLLQSKVPGVDVKSQDNQNRTLTGTVTAINGIPLAGAVVKMAGTNFGVITDENGRFIIHDVPEKKNLTVGYIGYDTKQIRVNNDSVNIALSPTKNALNEVSVSEGSMASKKSAEAHPKTGWKAFNNYLSKNATSPDGQTGKVSLLFTVDAQGNLNDFKIVTSVSTATDQKAIDLINKGPAWVGNADGQLHEVKLTVEFK
jgi:TonB family protein